MPWSTTFDYDECTQGGGGGQTSCADVQNDGIRWNWGANDLYGNYTQVAESANYSGGEGGNGARFWVGDGINIDSGRARIDFSPQTELWFRWYIRYQEGFNWSHLNYDKMMWIYPGTPGVTRSPGVIPEFKGQTGGDGFFTIFAQGPSDGYQVRSSTDFGWEAVMGGNVSHGEFFCVEIYIKMDTGQTDGVGRLWINGVLAAENEMVNWSNGNAVAQEGWTWIEFHGNQRTVDNANGPIVATVAYVDYDDMAIYNTTPPNVDAHGNPFIGTIRYRVSQKKSESSCFINSTWFQPF